MLKHIYSIIFILVHYLFFPFAWAEVSEFVPGSGIPLSFSADGRFVVFYSGDGNLVSGDTNNEADIFVYDRQMDVTERVSVSSNGAQGNDSVLYPLFRSANSMISADGRIVAFGSISSNLVPGDSNGQADIFVHDRETGITELVNISSTGVQANDYSNTPSLSADGRFVAFISKADNLVPGDTNNMVDHFIHDRETGITERVNLSSSGEQANAECSFNCPSHSLSADGRFVAFSSNADNLVDDDTNNQEDIFIHDRETGITERVSVSPSGVQMRLFSVLPTLSADGRFIAFTNNLVNIFVHDRNTGITEHISTRPWVSLGTSKPFLSADGRFVTFGSYADNLVSGDTNNSHDIFVYDREIGVTERTSVSSTGIQANAFSLNAIISPDGRFVAFESNADNLIPGNKNNNGFFIADNTLIDISDNLTVSLRMTSGATQVGEYIRFRASLKNNSDTKLTNCTAQIVNPYFEYPFFRRLFSFYTWPLNVANPVLNGGIDIAPGETGQINLAVLPRFELRREVRFKYACDKTKAVTIPFINTVHLTAKTIPLIAEDFVQLKNTNNKTELVIDRNNGKYWTGYAVNVSNMGSEETSVNLITTSNFPDAILRQPRLCEPIDPINNNWTCISPRDTQLQVDLKPGERKKIQVYVHARQSIDQEPVANRINLEAHDSAGEVVAKTSMGISTKN